MSLVKIEVLLLDVQDQAGLRRKQREGPVALVGLDHEGRAVGPGRVGPEQRHLRPDVVRGIDVGLAQDMGQHRRGGGLPVAARDDVGALGVGEDDEAFRAPHA